ncbi:NBAS subunit of NRZ tethering complex isoform X2 [Cavia porcellus]|uniref:NBAS subunit of NRZ tethering complex isoform X2 n=1 Tax=Cavia porcellus TaxID=10141 RepID=UPI002FE35C35
MAAPECGPASGPSSDKGEEETILYDLLVNTEWPPETEVQPRGNRKHGASFIITKAIRDYLLFLRQYLWYSPAPFLLPDGLVRLVNRQISWHLVLASNGKLLAAVQDQCVEIRSAKDDFTSIIGKCQVPKDPKPQWRRVAWSYDCTLLAYAESTGTVRVFNLMGSELFVIAPASSFAGDLSCAIAGLIFLEYKASAQWLAELLVINYRGELRSYLVSVETNQSYQESHSFSFSSHYPHGISTAIYHPAHSTHAGCGRRSDSSDFWEGTRSWQVCPTVVVLDDVHPLDEEMYGTFKHLLVDFCLWVAVKPQSQASRRQPAAACLRGESSQGHHITSRSPAVETGSQWNKKLYRGAPAHAYGDLWWPRWPSLGG